MANEVVRNMVAEFFAHPFNPDAQAALCSDKMEARFLNSWPQEKIMSKETFIECQRALFVGCPDWNYHAKILQPKGQQGYDTDAAGNLIVEVMIEPQCTHTGVLEIKLLGEKFEASNQAIALPIEWLSLLVKVSSGSAKVEVYQSNKVIDSSRASTNGLAGIPALIPTIKAARRGVHVRKRLLVAMGRPLPPPATDLLAPIPPYMAPDNRDPNFKLRIQVLKQICKSGDAEKEDLRRAVRQQQEELQRHMDYLSSIRNYC